jgi:general secretion pathway protein J
MKMNDDRNSVVAVTRFRHPRQLLLHCSNFAHPWARASRDTCTSVCTTGRDQTTQDNEQKRALFSKTDVTAMTRVHGFTLLELLVALSVFAIMSVMAYSGLRSVLTAREQTDAAADRLGEIQIAMNILQRDIQQAVNREVRAEYGDHKDAFQVVEDGEPRLELTRAGYRNPMQLPRSNLQRVGYGLEEKVLYRWNWPVLDRAQDTLPTKNVLLNDVENLEFRFLDVKGGWHTEWPIQRSDIGFDPDTQTPLPRAVEVNITLADWGKITRLLELPVGEGKKS